MYNNNDERGRGRGRVRGRGGKDNRGRGRGRGRVESDCNYSSWQNNSNSNSTDNTNTWNDSKKNQQLSDGNASNAWANFTLSNLQQNWTTDTRKNTSRSTRSNSSNNSWDNSNKNNKNNINASNKSWESSDRSTTNTTTSSWANNINKNTINDAWGNNTNDLSSSTGWDSQNNNATRGIKKSNDNNNTWDRITNTNSLGNNESDGWGGSTFETSSNWNPDSVSWVKTMNEPEKKEPGRGEWIENKHIIADRDPQVELKLFGDKGTSTMTSGINFTQYDNIPVNIKGDGVYEAMEKFSDPPLDSLLISNIELANFTVPTPVQKYSIPIVLSNRDLMACAQTGSGKTAGFLFPVLTKLFKSGPKGKVLKNKSTDKDRKAYPEVLILAPTRELASQIYNEAKKFAYRSYIRPCVVYGGADIGNQLRMLSRKCQLLVATPGRLVDILERRRLSLSNIRYLILDEADRMLDMGFEPQIRRIIQGEDMPPPGQRQTLMFSATFPTSIQSLASEFLHNYAFITVGRTS
ncbi:unnamed protein product [Cunninghamella echinulata]